MRHLNVSAIHSIPAFFFGCASLAACLFALFTINYFIDPSTVHGQIFPLPIFFAFVILPLAAIMFFPVFFFLRWIRFLNLVSLSGSLAIIVLILAWPTSLVTLRFALLLAFMAGIAGSVAFLVLRGWAHADARAKSFPGSASPSITQTTPKS